MSYSFFSLPAKMSEESYNQGHEYSRGNGNLRKTNNPPEMPHAPQKSAISVFRKLVEQPIEQPDFSNNRSALVAFARRELGSRYGLGRPLRKTELARLAGLADRHGARHVALLERGDAVLTGPLEVVLRMLLEGHASPWHERALASRYAERRTRSRKGAKG